jgi:hypothetical protein
MGEAKRRGTKQDRKDAAIAANNKIWEEQIKILQERKEAQELFKQTYKDIKND